MDMYRIKSNGENSIKLNKNKEETRLFWEAQKLFPRSLVLGSNLTTTNYKSHHHQLFWIAFFYIILFKFQNLDCYVTSKKNG